ncbi:MULTISPECIES: ATP-binding protein [unclassified Streptomyces]|uniref:ATP-binding protein n=1 Tax=unclassified Streptomyces TaxID=2593676 RepID=UPI00364B3BEE
MTHPTPVTAGPSAPAIGTAEPGAAVALYTTTLAPRAAVHTLTALADVATRQGWTVVHQAYDLAPLHVPARLRTGWRRVAQLLDSGEAVGLIVPAEREIVRTRSERAALSAWLLRLAAFAVYPHAGDQRSSLHPVGASAPIDRTWGRTYTLTRASLRRVRNDSRMFLTVLGWPGDVAVAAEVLSRLAENAVVHAGTAGGPEAEMSVRLSITEDDMLLVDVTDPLPEFPDSQAAIAGERGRGLMYAQLLGARVTWSLSGDARAKTVRAWLLPCNPDEVSP